MSAPPSPVSPRRWRGLGVRLFRLGLLAAVVWLLRSRNEGGAATLDAGRVRDFFPEAASLGVPDSSTGMQAVRDGAGVVIGLIIQTLPEAASIIGYAGPTNTLIAMDPKGVVMGVRILHSDDTPDHVAEVVGQRKFFAQFKDMRQGSADRPRVDGVSGATLTSSAIAEGVLNKLGMKGPSLRFPEEVTLEEVRDLDPKAAALRQPPSHKDQWQVLDTAGAVIGVATRTSPASDAVVGYKGPTDTLMLLDAEGKTVRGIRMRKSYDTQRYVGYVKEDSYFLKLFNSMPVDKLAALDFKAAKIEGVSGATETSWAMAEGLKRRAAELSGTPSHTGGGWLAGLRWRWQDTGHLAVLLGAFVMAFTRLRGRAWARHLHHALLVGYVGLFAGEMLSQALLAGWAKHGTPWRSAPGLVLLAVVALAGPVVTRRQLYCHHVCPHGALQQLLSRRLPWQWRVPAGWSRWLERLPLALLAFVLFAAALHLGVDLNALEPFDAYLWRVAGTSALIIAIVGLVASLFVPLAYCKYGCPTGALFKLLRYAGDEDRIGVRDWLALALVLAAAVLGAGRGA